VFAPVAELQTLLEGVPLPTAKRDLVDYAKRQDGGDGVLGLLSRLPDREYATLDEVGEELNPVQPRFGREPPLPREESGEPPGGPDYVA
jgi:Protein of unknown function (DUF2795)